MTTTTTGTGAIASALGTLRRIKTKGDDLVPAVFLPFALVLGIVFVFFIPPTQVVDESTHFLRAWQISQFDITTDVRFHPGSNMDRNGAVYDSCVIEYMDELTAEAQRPDDMAYGSFWHDTPDCSPRHREYYIIDPAAGYGPWSYPGQLVGLTTGRAIGLPLPAIFYLGRLTGLLAYVGVVWAALRIAPAARLAMFFVATLPMSMITAAAYQTDGIVLASVLFMCACLLRYVLVPESRSTRLMVGMAVAASVAVASKPNLAVLLALFLLLPAPDGMPARRWLGRRALAVGAGLVVIAMWYRFCAGAGTNAIYYPAADPSHQSTQVMHHPIGFLRLVWHTSFDFTSEVFMVRGWPGVFGMQRGRESVAVVLPTLLVMLAFGVGVLAHVLLAGERREIALRTRLCTIAVFVAVLSAGPLSVFYVAFTQWTDVGARRIEGVQARYFLPYLPVAAAGVALLRKRSNLQLSTGFFGVSALVLAIASLNQMRMLFY